jgi:hypothetical protein
MDVLLVDVGVREGEGEVQELGGLQVGSWGSS